MSRVNKLKLEPTEQPQACRRTGAIPYLVHATTEAPTARRAYWDVERVPA